MRISRKWQSKFTFAQLVCRYKLAAHLPPSYFYLYLYLQPLLPSKMANPIERPQTPSPTYPMTPPPTGRHEKRARFAEAESGSNFKSRHTVKSKEGESPDASFEKLASDAELNESSDNETITSASDTAPSSPVSATSKTLKTTTLQYPELFASLAIAVNISATFTNPFPFMKLPLSVRRRIYEYLLVVPGLVCVRQNYTASVDETRTSLNAERREFLPGIAYALAQLSVDGYKIRFSRFASTNINILRTSKEVYAEAQVILYYKNAFEIVKPTDELCPPPDYGVRLFPTGCQRLVTRLNIRIRSFYDLNWLLDGGYDTIKNFYRGLNTLTLILELDSANKGFGKAWARNKGEMWAEYVDRLRDEVSKELLRKMKKSTSGGTTVVPTWMHLRVLFSGESYDGMFGGGGERAEKVKRDELRVGLVETWESFRKGGK
jgi:hypothetical protein